MGLRALILPLILTLAPLGAGAQEPSGPAQIQSPILTIDVDRLLAGTLYGRRMAEELRARTEALAAENERLRLELTGEEQSLTDRRPTMEVEDFRAEADAFDARVQRIRQEQDAKQQALEATVEEGRQRFLNDVTPVLGGLMIESGAAVILERRDVFLSASLVDITEEAIRAIDARLGDGITLPEQPEPAPGAAAEPADGGTPAGGAAGDEPPSPLDAPDPTLPEDASLPEAQADGR